MLGPRLLLLLATGLVTAGCGIGGTTTVVSRPSAPPPSTQGTATVPTTTERSDPDDPGFSAERVASLLESRLQARGATVSSASCTPSLEGQFGCGVVARTKSGGRSTFTYTAEPDDGTYDFESQDGKGLEPDPGED